MSDLAFENVFFAPEMSFFYKDSESGK